jgi:hypothetical protein
MPSFRSGRVTAILAERRGLQRVEVDGERAYVLTDLVGPVAPDDEVVMNTTAVDLGLGTGGWHVVHWNLSRRSWSAPGRGHVMKLRYTSLQADIGATEEHREVPTELDGTPVVACTLHSQVACVAAAFKHTDPEARLAYVMTDGAALPLALSELVVAMTESGLIDGTVTAGNAFGGDLEAVNIPSALALAVHELEADAVVVGMGPGVVGTGTTLGTTALEAVGVLDATAALGGKPVLALRVSLADSRSRHTGVSHHSRTVLALARSGVRVPVPTGFELDAPRHLVEIVDPPDMALTLAAHHVQVSSMGRGPEDDPAFFAAAGAAGTLAGRMVLETVDLS